MNDLRTAVRLLFKNPVFSIVAILSLAVGIGANTAIFSLVNDFLLRTLPVRNPEALVLFRNITGKDGRMSRAGENNGSIDPVSGREASTSFSLLMFERMRGQRAALSDLFAFAPFSQVNILVESQPDITGTAQLVSGNYHAALGVPTAVGRTLTLDDDQAAAPPVAVISYRYWERRFGRRADVIGETIAINRVPTTIVGVTARGFDGTMQAGESPDVSVPIAHYLRFQPDRRGRAQPSYWWIRVMGRLAPGATPAQAAASLEPIFQEAAREGWLSSPAGAPDERTPDVPTLAADPGARGENDVRRQFAGSLRMLMALVSLVLAAACANVANLLLARSSARRREIAVRLALGASRGRIVRQLFVESLLLAGLGAAVGVMLAWWSRDVLLALRPFGNTTVVLDLPLDARVLGFTVAVTVATALLFGLSPALRATKVDLNTEFQRGGRALGSGARSLLGRGLIAVQIALSLVLLISTGLFVRTVNKLEHVDAGFNRHDLALFRIDAASAGYTRDQFTTLQSRLQERLDALPGVRAVTFSSTALLSRVRQNKRIGVAGQAPSPGQLPIVNTNGVALNFFRAMELPLLLGREFTEHDTAATPRVAIVNQAFVRAYFGDANPIGQHLVIPSYADRVEVVGVTGSAKYTDLRGATPPTVYFPFLQQVDGNANFAVRMGPRQVSGALFTGIRSAVREIDPALPVLNLRTQDEQIDRLHGQELLFARLSGLFGGIALLLTCVGLYGLLSHAVLRRTGEIGLRMALGAVPADVLRMILRESLVLATLGIVGGLVAAFGAGRFIASMLFDVSPADPLTYAVAGAILLAIAVLASLAPAWRASRIQPVTALKLD